jgi:hypothetical protein
MRESSSNGGVVYPALRECVQQLGRHDNEEVVMT